MELQARREYEGAGEYPSFIGWDCERFAEELAGCGKHRGHLGVVPDRWLASFPPASPIWKTTAATSGSGSTPRPPSRVFKNGATADSSVEKLSRPGALPAALELLDHADTVIRELLYIGEFAEQKLFFRRVRIPPLLHVYWDSLFINHGGAQGDAALRAGAPSARCESGETAAALFPRMIELATRAGLPVDDIEHMAISSGCCCWRGDITSCLMTNRLPGKSAPRKRPTSNAGRVGNASATGSRFHSSPSP